MCIKPYHTLAHTFYNINIRKILNCASVCIYVRCLTTNNWAGRIGRCFKEDPLKMGWFCIQKPAMLGNEASFSPKDQLVPEPKKTRVEAEAEDAV